MGVNFSLLDTKSATRSLVAALAVDGLIVPAMVATRAGARMVDWRLERNALRGSCAEKASATVNKARTWRSSFMIRLIRIE